MTLEAFSPLELLLCLRKTKLQSCDDVIFLCFFSRIVIIMIMIIIIFIFNCTLAICSASDTDDSRELLMAGRSRLSIQEFASAIPNHLLLGSLLEHLCFVYESNPARSRMLFKGMQSETYENVSLFEAVGLFSHVLDHFSL